MKKTYRTVVNSKIVDRKANQAAIGVISGAMGYCPSTEAGLDHCLRDQFPEENHIKLALAERLRKEEVDQDRAAAEEDADFWTQEPTADQLATIENE